MLVCNSSSIVDVISFYWMLVTYTQCEYHIFTLISTTITKLLTSKLEHAVVAWTSILHWIYAELHSYTSSSYTGGCFLLTFSNLFKYRWNTFSIYFPKTFNFLKKHSLQQEIAGLEIWLFLENEKKNSFHLFYVSMWYRVRSKYSKFSQHKYSFLVVRRLVSKISTSLAYTATEGRKVELKP